jgi:hypothetical protein
MNPAKTRFDTSSSEAENIQVTLLTAKSESNPTDQ